MSLGQAHLRVVEKKKEQKEKKEKKEKKECRKTATVISGDRLHGDP